MPIEQESRLRPDSPALTSTVRWSLSARVLFRSCFAYLLLFSLGTQTGALFTIPRLEIPRLGSLWPLRQITFWTAAHVFRLTRPIVYISPSHDKTFDWVQTFCVLVLAIVIVAIWSIADRARENYVAL